MTESKQKVPKRGRRYAESEKEAILKYAEEYDVAGAAEKFQVSDVTIYEWRRAARRRGKSLRQAGAPGGSRR